MSNQVQPTIMGAVTGALTATLSAVTNTAKMVDNAAVAGERITYIAASKASNLAHISDTADTMKLLLAKKELQDQMTKNGVTINKDGEMVFA